MDSLLLIELHGMDVSNIENMQFLRSLNKPKEFDSYTGISAVTAFWTGIDEFKNGSYHSHIWNGSSSCWDRNFFRLLRGDLYFSKNVKKGFRLARTKHYFQVCKLFKEFDFCYSERPLIATNRFIYIDLAKNEFVRIKRFKKHWNKTLNFIRLRNIDILGHKFGPKSEEIKEYSYRLDSALENIYNNFNGETIIFSLYGMISPHINLDVFSYLKTLQDLIFFIDDENIRIWENGAKESIDKAIKYLNNLRCGLWLENKPDKKFGDLFFKAHEGVAFVPNHFVQRNEIKGIHSSQGWMVSNCGYIDKITEFKKLIENICSQ